MNITDLLNGVATWDLIGSPVSNDISIKIFCLIMKFSYKWLSDQMMFMLLVIYTNTTAAYQAGLDWLNYTTILLVQQEILKRIKDIKWLLTIWFKS